MGCPQGSVLALTLWNLVFDNLLSAPVPQREAVIGCEDDEAVVVEANSRPTVGHKADWALVIAVEWGNRNKLSFSVEKTKALVLKGPRIQSPLIKMTGAGI